jgi:hypothetical protein
MRYFPREVFFVFFGLLGVAGLLGAGFFFGFAGILCLLEMVWF